MDTSDIQIPLLVEHNELPSREALRERFVEGLRERLATPVDDAPSPEDTSVEVGAETDGEPIDPNGASDMVEGAGASEATESDDSGNESGESAFDGAEDADEASTEAEEADEELFGDEVDESATDEETVS